MNWMISIEVALEPQPHLRIVEDPTPVSLERHLHVLNRRYSAFTDQERGDFSILLQLAVGNHEAMLRGLGNPVLQESYALRLPRAIARIHRQVGPTPGLFVSAPKARGKWSTAWIGDLAHSSGSVADGIAYEVLATDCLLAQGAFGSRITERDTLSFGFKLQASYPGSEALLENQPNRQTVESDMQLFIIESGIEVGVDFKHTHGTRPIRLSSSQLAGVRCALATGETDFFCFVTNGRFSPSSHAAAAAANSTLDPWVRPTWGGVLNTDPLVLVESVTVTP